MPSVGCDPALAGRRRGRRRAGRAPRSSRSAGPGVGGDGDGSGLDPGVAIADLEQPARTDAEERVAPEALAALDRLEEVGRAAVIEAEEGTDRRLEVGRARGAQEDRVGVGGEALRLRQADRVRGAHRLASRIRQRPFVPGTKGRAFRGATLIRRVPHSRDRRPGFETLDDRRCPVSLALCAGAYWVGGRPRRSVRRLPGPFPVAAAPVSTSHRVSLPTRDGYSSRSQPVLRDVAGWWQGRPAGVKRSRQRGRSRRSIVSRSEVQAHADGDAPTRRIAAFLDAAGPWLVRREAEHNLMLGILGTAIETPAASGDLPPYLAAVDRSAAGRRGRRDPDPAVPSRAVRGRRLRARSRSSPPTSPRRHPT